MKQRILVSHRFTSKKNSEQYFNNSTANNSGFYSTSQKESMKKFKAIDDQMDKWNLEYISDVY